MSAEENLAIVQDIHAAFARGDLPAVLARISEDVTEFNVISSAPSHVPWHIPARGKAGAARFFEILLGTVEFRAFEPRDYAATGDHVYATLRMLMHVRASGAQLELAEVVHHFTLESGMVVRWRATEDTHHSDAAFAPR